MKLVYIFAAVLFALISAGVLAIGIVFSDDFNDRDISDWRIPLPYSPQGGSATVDVSTNWVYEGTASIHFTTDIGKINTAYAESPVTDFAGLGDYNASFYFLIPKERIDPTSSHWFKVFYNGFVNIVYDNGADKKYVAICDQGTGPLNYKVVSPQLVGDQWYKFEIVVRSTSANYDVYVDGQLQATCNKFSGPTDRILIGDEGANGADYGEAYWDLMDVKVVDDTTPPIITVLSPNALINRTNVGAQISLNENAASCTATLDSRALQQMSQNPDSRHWYAAFENMQDGPHSARFSCTDLNQNTGEANYNFVVDTTAPDINLQSPKNKNYPESFVWVNATTNEISSCSYNLDETTTEALDTSDGLSFSKNLSGFSGFHNVSVSCSDAAENSATTQKIIFSAGLQEVSRDVDNDSNSESAKNSDGNFSNGYENYTDADESSNLYAAIDGDSDGEIDFLINTTGGPEPEVYWDPDNDVVSDIPLVDVNNDGTKDFVFDSDGNGTDDKWYNPLDGTVGNYTPPQPPQPPQPPPQQNNPGGCCGGGPPGPIIYLRENFTFINPPSKIFATFGAPLDFEFTVSNTGYVTTNVSFNFTGTPTDWFSVIPTKSELRYDGTTTYKIRVLPTEIGNYSVKIIVQGNEISSEHPMELFVETAPPTTTTTTIPRTTTTTSPAPSGITGAILFVTNNPLVSGAAAVLLIVGGSVLWSMKKPVVKAKKAEEKKSEPAVSETPPASQ